MSTVTKQHLLINEVKEDYEYDPARVLRLWSLLLPEVPESDSRGFAEYPAMTDEDRVIALFELLQGSQFGDMIFGALGNFDQGSILIEREDL